MHLRRWLVSLLTISGVALAASQSKCAEGTLSTRKAWTSLTDNERLDYIEAIKCLRKRPSALPNTQFPGVRDRWDDFAAIHINYTLVMHANGQFLPWHRHFLHLWETALQEECGYKGNIPYWDWTQSTGNISTFPIMDGSATSLGGNGIYDANEEVRCPPNEACPPKGTGGGCINSGPFKNFQAHMGPFAHSWFKTYGPLPSNAFAYQPHCVTRSFNQWKFNTYVNPGAVAALLNSEDVVEFLDRIESGDIDSTGVHGGGHISIGGDMGDVFGSAQDPLFMPHHAMVDRMWAFWQARDPGSRQFALNGTTILGNPVGSPEVTLDTVLEFGVLDRPRRMREVMDVKAYDYCYGYS